jgi:O-glycosyl hydrolase
MKTIIALLTTTMLVAGATSAMAYDRQATDDALSSASVQTSHGFGGAFASARVPGEARNSTVNAPTQDDFQLDGR